jgi:hypothetical protein
VAELLGAMAWHHLRDHLAGEDIELGVTAHSTHLGKRQPWGGAVYDPVRAPVSEAGDRRSGMAVSDVAGRAGQLTNDRGLTLDASRRPGMRDRGASAR